MCFELSGTFLAIIQNIVYETIANYFVLYLHTKIKPQSNMSKRHYLADEVLEMVDSNDERNCGEPVMEGSDDNSDLELEDHEDTLKEEG